MTPITEALAQTPQHASGVGDFPLIQSAFALLILIIGGIAALRGAMRDRSPPAKEGNGPGTVVYMDGPLVEALQEIKKLTGLIERGVEQLGKLVELFPAIDRIRLEFTQQARQAGHDAFNRIHPMFLELDVDHKKLEERVRELENQIARMEGTRRR